MTLSQIPNQLPGLEEIGGGVNTKTAAYAAWNSITSLLELPSDPAKWEQVQVLQNRYNVPRGFLVSVGDTSTSTQVTGSGRDDYMENITSSLKASGSVGGFSGTLHSSFDMNEDTTEAYSFGTCSFERQVYSLTLPNNLDGLLDTTFERELKGSMSPTDFYEKWGTHYTSSILLGAKASLSLFSQFDSQYSDSTFKTDLSAAYKEVVASFQIQGTFSYKSDSSSEKYESSSSLVLVGGDTTKTSYKDWQSTIVDFPQFFGFNTQAASAGLVPIYRLLAPGSRREQLKNALTDYLNPPLGLHIFCAASSLTEYPIANVEVPINYKVLSGGAKVAYQGEGELLTASYPVSDNQWAAKAKDADFPDKAILTVYAVAVYDPHKWLDVKVFQKASASAEHPATSVSVDTGYAITGGGALVKYPDTCGGNYLTASYPILPDTWSVASKDHFNKCPAPITAYAIGVKWSSAALTNSKFPKPKAITSQYVQESSNPIAHPNSTVAAPSGTTMVGGGAHDDYGTGVGNMLYASYPCDAKNWSASGKDHEISSPATLTAYAIGVCNMVDPTLPSS